MDTRRLILVMIFTFSSFMLWENWQKFNQPKPVAPAAAAPATAADGTAPTPSVSLQPGATAVVASAPAAPASKDESFTISTDLFKATVSTRGGDLTIVWGGDGRPVLMTGPAVTVFSGEIEL